LNKPLQAGQGQSWKDLLHSFRDHVPLHKLIEAFPEHFRDERFLTTLIQDQILVTKGNGTISLESIVGYLGFFEEHYTFDAAAAAITQFLRMDEHMIMRSLKHHAVRYLHAGFIAGYPTEKGVLGIHHDKLYEIAAAIENRGKPCAIDTTRWRYDPRVYENLDFTWPSKPLIIARSVLLSQDQIYIRIPFYFWSKTEDFGQQIRATLESGMSGTYQKCIHCFEITMLHEQDRKAVYITAKDAEDRDVKEYLRCFRQYLRETLPVWWLLK
jgi:hypothetical protein